MPVKLLNDTQKHFVVHNYQQKKYNQKQLAQYFMVSQRTINRVLVEAGVATPVARIKGEAYQVMQLLNKYRLDLPALKNLIASQPSLLPPESTVQPLTIESVQAFLVTCSKEELMELFFEAGLAKIAEMYNTSVQTATLNFSQKAEAAANKVLQGNPS